MQTATPLEMLQRLSRNLRQLHLANDDFLAGLRDAERVLELGQGQNGWGGCHRIRSCISQMHAAEPSLSLHRS